MYDTDKPYPIYLYKHEFWGYLDLVITVPINPSSITTSIESENTI